MESTPKLKKVEIVSGYTARWKHKGFRCRLEASSKGVTVSMKGGAEQLGNPGEEFVFEHSCGSLEQARELVDSLPESFGPDDCERLGFKQTMYVIYD